jgi:hypothetical protein
MWGSKLMSMHDSEFREWLSSEEEQQILKASDALWGLMEDVGVDPRQRRLVFPDGRLLTFGESVSHIHAQRPEVGTEDIADFLLDWMEDCVGIDDPESVDPGAEQRFELHELVSEWVSEIERERTPSP